MREMHTVLPSLYSESILFIYLFMVHRSREATPLLDTGGEQFLPEVYDRVAGYLPDIPTVVVAPRVDFVVYGRVVFVAPNDDVTWSGHANFVLRSDRVRVQATGGGLCFFAVLFSPAANVRRKTEKYKFATWRKFTDSQGTTVVTVIGSQPTQGRDGDQHGEQPRRVAY